MNLKFEEKYPHSITLFLHFCRDDKILIDQRYQFNLLKIRENAFLASSFVKMRILDSLKILKAKSSE